MQIAGGGGHFLCFLCHYDAMRTKIDMLFVIVWILILINLSYLQINSDKYILGNCKKNFAVDNAHK